MKKHLTIFEKEVLTEMLENRKSIETRFSKHKIAPYQQIEAGDLVYIKPAGGEIIAQFYVKKVIFFENLDAEDWEYIKKIYGPKLSLGNPQKDEEFFKSKSDSRYGTLLFIDRLETLIASPIIPKKDRRGWLVLDE